jgi:hypothetical protein
LAVLAGCTPRSPPAETHNLAPRPSAPRDAFQIAIDAARAKRDALDASSPPPYAGDGSKQAALDYTL